MDNITFHPRITRIFAKIISAEPIGDALNGRPRIRWVPDGKAIVYKDDGQGLWRQALDEEKPTMVNGFEELRVRQLAWSFNGKNLAYASGPTTQEITVIENFK